MVREISVLELKKILGDLDKNTFVDVRGTDEYALAQIPGFKCIPLQDLTHRVNEVDKKKTVICLCHHGRRSLAAAEIFSSAGFTDVVSVRGGIHAYAVQVDPSIPTY